MRIRSCQLVYLLLLLCSVQGLESRAFTALANGPATLAAQEESLPAPVSTRLNRLQAYEPAAEQAAGVRPDAQVATAADPARHAIAVAIFTSFTRG